jgi:hypothetical protein
MVMPSKGHLHMNRHPSSVVQAQQRRYAIRRTWALLAVQHAPRTTVRFFLAQPPAASRVAFIESGAYALLQVHLGLLVHHRTVPKSCQLLPLQVQSRGFVV